MKRLSRTSFRISAWIQDKTNGSEVAVQESGSSNSSSGSGAAAAAPSVAMKDLHDFLVEAELSEYCTPLMTRLKVTTVEHLKYVQEEDLQDIGMTRPEMRRLKKFYRKEFPQGAINRLKKAILKGGGDGPSRTHSSSPPAHRGPRPLSAGAPYVRPSGRQIIPADSIQLSRTLGEGEFGVVQQGIWTTESGEKLQVAVKRLSRERVNTETQNFLKEAAIMQDVDHDYIVRMFGVVLDMEDNMMLVTELAPMRSLLECLKDSNLRIDLPVPRLCDYTQQVCEGMSYLESKRLVHRDLAARNILVFNKYQVKISDLGLSRLLGVGQDYYQSKFSVSLKLPIAWCAPECINFLKFTSASDVWSFGVMLWEFFTYGFQPWAGLNGQQILQAIDEPSCQRLEQPDLCTNDMYKLMRECWQHNPEARPTFSEILLRLPQLRPSLVKAVKDYSPIIEKGSIQYKSGDVIVVIDKSPATSAPVGLLWKGVLASGKCGLFDPTNVVPVVESKASPGATKTASLIRKESSRKSGKKLRADMISNPQNDLRHTGHIGYDGAVFGDVSFIGDNYDKLPVKVGSGGGSSCGSSVLSLPLSQDSPDHNGHIMTSISQDSLDKGRRDCGQSWISQESLNSQSTYQLDEGGRASPSYLDIEDDSLFSDFRMPDLGKSFDFGPSFMDEVLKALDEKDKLFGSDTDTASAANHSRQAEPSARTTTNGRPEPPVPAAREPRTSSSSSAPPLPAQPPPVDPPKEKKQAKVKPMSASEEKMVDTAMARARELTSHLIGGPGMSPPVSPSQVEKSSFFEDEAGILSKLKNSIKRSSSPRNERKRTFSEELGQKGTLDDEVTPEAQQAYNMLVVKGSFKSKSASGTEHQSQPGIRDLAHRDVSELRRSTSRSSSHSLQEFEPSERPEPNLIKDSRIISSPTKLSPAVPVQTFHSPAVTVSYTTPPIMSPRPLVSPPQPPTKPVGVTQPKFVSGPSAPVPAPRPIKQDSLKKSEFPIPRPRPEIQRVEPTIRQMVPASPDILPKSEKRIDSHFLVQTSKEREELKKTIEIIRVDESGVIQDDVLEKASASFDCSSARSSQRSSSDHSDNASEIEHVDEEYSGCSSDSSRFGRDTNTRTSLSVDRKDSFNKKQASSPFEEDLSAPSPQEIMSRLRERRLNRHMDHQRALAGEGDALSAVTTSRPRLSVREPQGIPGRSSGMESEDGSGGGDGGGEEVDTNPLRMLRGGAIPIRTAGRGTAGMGINGNRGALALRVPRLNFCRDLSRIAASQKTDAKVLPSPDLERLTADSTHHEENSNDNCAAASTSGQEILGNSGASKQSMAVLRDDSTAAESSVAIILPPSHLNSVPAHYVNSNRISRETEDSSSGSSLDSSANAQRPEKEALIPPRLPPRRSQSLNENSEKADSHLSVLPIGLRRSNSVNENKDIEAPALPPREPHSGRTPLNVRPRERKFPLQIHVPSQIPKLSGTSPHASPTTPTSKQAPLFRAHANVLPSPTSALSPSYQPSSVNVASQQIPSHNFNHQSPPITYSPKSHAHNLSNKHPALQNNLMSRSLDSSSIGHHLHHHHHHHHHSNSIDLPPAYNLSTKHSSLSCDVADSEPTHMLLDPHTPRFPLPLSVSLPPASDLTIDEPTHVSLSSLTDNKHSWSSTFTSPSPLSIPLHQRHHHFPPNTSETCSSPGRIRTFDRSLSHDPHIHTRTQYPDFSDNQSPPADLPPAPPTPSYREKLGLEQPKPKVSRSLSHNPNSIHHHHAASHSLSLDNTSSPQLSYRGRSASTNSPRNLHKNLSPSHSSNHPVFRFPDNSHDDDDSAFFSEAPSYPHPYSQSTFRPIISSHSKELLHASSLYNTVPSIQPPDISPYQISSPVSVNLSSKNSSSLHPCSRQDSSFNHHTRQNTYNHSRSLHTKSHSHTVSPRINLIRSPDPISHSSSHPGTSSPKPISRLAQGNCVNSQSNSHDHRSTTHTSLSSQPGKSELSHSTASHIFQFPNSGPTNGSFIKPPSSSSAAVAQLGTTRHRTTNSPNLSPTLDSPSSSEVSPLMFASYTAASSVSYEDLRQFALDRQKNCEEIDTLLKTFQDQVTVEECMTALERTQWDVSKATKYLQLKKLLSLGVADVHKCKEALSSTGWDLQRAADTLLELAKTPGKLSSSSSSSLPSSRGPPGHLSLISPRNRPVSPEIVDV